MADRKKSKKKSPYTEDRGMPGAFEGETVTRRRLFEGGALAAGGIASAAFALPALGFALGPVFEETVSKRFQDVGPEGDFNEQTYVSKVITVDPDVGEAGKTTVYIRKFNPKRDNHKNENIPYVAISTRCMHLGCPVRYVNASQRFICPCHGGVYGFQGEVAGGPPVRPLDRFYTKVQPVPGKPRESGAWRVKVGNRFSLNAQFDRFSPRDPGQHLDGLWEYLYPKRFTT